MLQPVSDLRLCFSLRGTGQTLLSASPRPPKAAHWGVSGHLQPPQCSLSRFSCLIWHKRGNQILIFRKLHHSLPPLCCLSLHIHQMLPAEPQPGPRLLPHLLLPRSVLIRQLQEQPVCSSAESSDIFVHTALTSCFLMQQKSVDSVLIIGFHLFPVK